MPYQELKRVPLEFNWPLSVTWIGSVNPYQSFKCPFCENGESPESRPLRESLPYFGAVLTEDEIAALLEGNRLLELTHEIVVSKWVKKSPEVIPTPEDVRRWSLVGIGHDGINRAIIMGARCKRHGVPRDCPHCQGTSFMWFSKEVEESHNAWEPRWPPVGLGYQLWKDTREGKAPFSPVFDSLSGLSVWCSSYESIYTEKSDPSVWEEYLSTGRASYTVGPVTFLL